MPELIFMGTSDSKGVPRFYCDCPVCEEARSTGLNRRTRPGLWLRGTCSTLIDCPPDFHAQALREQLRHLDLLLLTHGHNDHILGLGDVLDSITYAGLQTPIFAPAEVPAQVQSRFAYLRKPDWILPLPADLEVEGYRVSAFQVPHGANGFSYAYRFEKPAFAWVYCPDSIGIPLQTQQQMLNLDLLVLGTSFWQEPYEMRFRSVYDVQEALELEPVQTAKQVVLTHLSHGVDARQAPLPAHVRLAHDGLKLQLP